MKPPAPAHIRCIIVGLLACLFQLGCAQNSNYPSQPRKIPPEALTAIRQTINRQANLSSSEKTVVATVQPHTSQYIMAADFGQYRFAWDLNLDKELVVEYEGSLSRIDPAKLRLTVKERE